MISMNELILCGLPGSGCCCTSETLWMSLLVTVRYSKIWMMNLSVLMLMMMCDVLFSWELASALKEYKSKFDSAGVKLIAVGVGAPDKARILAERVRFLYTIIMT